MGPLESERCVEDGPEGAKNDGKIEGLPPEKPVVCTKCGSENLRWQAEEIITFREGKPYATMRALPGEKFSICNVCQNVMVKAEEVDFRLLNRSERRRIAILNKKRGKK